MAIVITPIRSRLGEYGSEGAELSGQGGGFYLALSFGELDVAIKQF